MRTAALGAATGGAARGTQVTRERLCSSRAARASYKGKTYSEFRIYIK